MRFDRKQSLLFLSGLLNRRLQLALDRALFPYGITFGQLPTLFSLYEEDGLSQRQLCERNLVEQPTMANTLRRMERDGLIEIQQDKSDKRRSLYTLTSRARRIQRDVITTTTTVIQQTLDGLPHQRVVHLVEMLNRMNENLKTVLDDGAVAPASTPTTTSLPVT